MDPSAMSYPRYSGSSEPVSLDTVIAQRFSYTLNPNMQSEFLQSQHARLPQSWGADSALQTCPILGENGFAALSEILAGAVGAHCPPKCSVPGVADSSREPANRFRTEPRPSARPRVQALISARHSIGAAVRGASGSGSAPGPVHRQVLSLCGRTWSRARHFSPPLGAHLPGPACAPRGGQQRAREPRSRALSAGEPRPWGLPPLKGFRQQSVVRPPTSLPSTARGLPGQRAGALTRGNARRGRHSGPGSSLCPARPLGLGLRGCKCARGGGASGERGRPRPPPFSPPLPPTASASRLVPASPGPARPRDPHSPGCRTALDPAQPRSRPLQWPGGSEANDGAGRGLRKESHRRRVCAVPGTSGSPGFSSPVPVAGQLWSSRGSPRARGRRRPPGGVATRGGHWRRGRPPAASRTPPSPVAAPLPNAEAAKATPEPPESLRSCPAGRAHPWRPMHAWPPQHLQPGVLAPPPCAKGAPSPGPGPWPPGRGHGRWWEGSGGSTGPGSLARHRSW
nr:basic proline-rich protein [Oryctolagus cuniculus]